jgi:hypothetical protein
MATTTTVTNVSGSAAQTDGRQLDVFGARRVGLFRVANAGTYAAGGIAFDPTAFGFDRPVATVFLAEREVAASVTRHWKYDFVNKKIIGFVTSTGVEIANGQDVSTIVFDALVVSE